MAKEDKYVLKQFRLDPENPSHSKIIEFINLAPAKSLTQMVVIAFSELIETYGLDDSNAEDVKNFINFYQYYRKKSENDAKRASEQLLRMFVSAAQVQPSVSIPIETVETASANETLESNLPDTKRKSLVSQEEKDAMKQIMSAFS